MVVVGSPWHVLHTCSPSSHAHSLWAGPSKRSLTKALSGAEIQKKEVHALLRNRLLPLRTGSVHSPADSPSAGLADAHAGRPRAPHPTRSLLPFPKELGGAPGSTTSFPHSRPNVHGTTEN